MKKYIYKCLQLCLYFLLTISVSHAVTLTSIAVSPQGAAIIAGGTYQFTVTCTYSDNSTDNCTNAGGATWTSSLAYSGNMTVSSTGLATYVTDPGTGNTASGYVVATAGGLSDRGALYAQHSGDTFYVYTTPDPNNFQQTITGTLQPMQLVVGSNAALGLGLFINSGAYGAGTGTPFQDACVWGSSNTSIATVNKIGDVTAVAPGTVTITCTLNGNAVYGTSTAPNWVSPGNSIALTVVAAPATSTTTWYVRPDGGTLYSATNTSGQCNGQANAAYPGSGTNQPCAAANLRYLWADGATYQQMQWVIHGGDTVIVAQNSNGYNIGADSPASVNGSNPTNCAGNYSGCYMPSIPSGSSSQHTQILGANYANCHADSAKTLLLETYGTYAGINVKDSQFVDVKCFEITQKASCVPLGNFINNCQSTDNFGDKGILESALTSNDNFEDIFIHGLTDGIFGAVGVGTVADHIHIRAMGDAGVSMDDDPWNMGNISVAGGWTLTNSLTEFTGCVEVHPIVKQYPFIECRDQNAGGYGDGFGSASTSGTWYYDHDTWRYNYQDGLDLLHSGMQKLTVTNSQSYGNDGNEFKIGSGLAITFQNNLAVNNCLRIGMLFGDEYPTAIYPAFSGTATAGTGLTVNISSGSVTIGVYPNSQSVLNYAGGTVTVPASATTYLWFDPTTGAVTQGTAYPAQPAINGRQIAQVVSSTTAVTAVYPQNNQVSLCRAGGTAVLWRLDGLGVDNFQNNTEVGDNQVAYEGGCTGGWDACLSATSNFQNNVIVSYQNSTTNSGVGSQSIFYIDTTPNSNMPGTNGGGWSNMTYNDFYNNRHGCVTGTGMLCVDPQFVNEPNPTTIINNELPLDFYNFNPSSTSGIIGTGTAISGLTVDIIGDTRPATPSMGALEYIASPTATTTNLSVSSSTVPVGQPVTFVASPVSGTTSLQSEFVNFYSNGTLIGAQYVDPQTASATFTTSNLPQGTNTITASYAQQGGYGPSTSSPFSLIVGTATKFVHYFSGKIAVLMGGFLH